MDVATAKAQLVEAEAREALQTAKVAYQKKPSDANKAKLRAAQAEMIEARNHWRNNFRKAPDGPGDGTASPAPVEASIGVNS